MWGDTNELEKKVRDAGGEMDAPGGGRYRFVGNDLWHYTAKEIEEEKQAKQATQFNQDKIESERADKMKKISAVDAIAQTSPGYQWSPEKPETVVAGMNDEALQREKALTAEMPIGGFNEATKKTGYLDAIARVANKPRSDIMPKALDKFSAANQQLAQYGDTEPVKNYLDNIKSEATMEQKSANPGGGKNGWAVRLEQAKAIDALPDGPEKESAIEKFTRDWATSTWAGYQPGTIRGAADRAAAVQGATMPGAIRQAGAAAEAGAAGRIKAETDAGGGVNPVITDRTSSMRKEFLELPEIKSVKTLQSNASKANKAMTDYKAGKIKPYEVDQSLGYFASKALDPNSVVMPGEFDRFAKGLGLQSAQAMVEQLIGGGLKLTDAQRESMLGIVNRAMDSGKEAAQSQYDYYSDLAVKNGTDPHGVTGGVDYIFKKTTGTTTDSANSPAKSYLEEIRTRRALLQGQ